MESFLSILYNGRFAPWEHQQENELIANFISKKDHIKSLLKERLSETDFRNLEVFEHQFTCISGIEKENTFGYGFSMGILLMIEVFAFKEELAPTE